MNLLYDFLHDRIDPHDFDHRSHVVVAYDLLTHHDFDQSYAAYVKHLRALTVRAGVPEKFNATITFAAMSMIAERMEMQPTDTADQFLSENSDLLRASSFTQGYSKDRFSSALARRVPLLPDLSSNAD